MESKMPASVTLECGKKLYRIRKDNGQNLEDEKEWGMCPIEKCNQGRFNKTNKPVLYLGTDECFLKREVNLKAMEQYYLAEYQVIEDFNVATLLISNNRDEVLDYILSRAVSWETLRKQEQEVLTRYCASIVVELSGLFKMSSEHTNIKPYLNFNDVKNIVLPYLINVSGTSMDDLYNKTNKIFDKYTKSFPCGLRYSSVYNPIEMNGTPFSPPTTLNGEEYGNFALTELGFKKIKFIKAEKKTLSVEDYYNNTLTMAFETFLFPEKQS